MPQRDGTAREPGSNLSNSSSNNNNMEQEPILINDSQPAAEGSLEETVPFAFPPEYEELARRAQSPLATREIDSPPGWDPLKRQKNEHSDDMQVGAPADETRGEAVEIVSGTLNDDEDADLDEEGLKTPNPCNIPIEDIPLSHPLEDGLPAGPPQGFSTPLVAQLPANGSGGLDMTCVHGINA